MDHNTSIYINFYISLTSDVGAMVVSHDPKCAICSMSSSWQRFTATTSDKNQGRNLFEKES